LKSKEKFADSLMAIANAVHCAVLVSLLVFPLTVFVSAIFSGAELFSFLSILERMTWPNIGIFTFVYLLPVFFGTYAKEKAME
jgi:hypothetical protein